MCLCRDGWCSCAMALCSIFLVLVSGYRRGVPARYRGDGGNACRGGTVLVWWLLWRSLAVLGDTTPGPGTDCSQGVLLPTISFALICVPSS